MERKSCPACESLEHATIFSCDFQQTPILPYLKSFYGVNAEFNYLIGATFILDKCKNCGLIYQREIPDVFLMEKLYQERLQGPKHMAEIHGDSFPIERHDLYAREMKMLLLYFNKDPGQLDFLDVGMGWGSWSLIAQSFGFNTYGIELSQYLIDFGRSQGVKMITWDELAGNSFDFINTDQFFEHISHPLDTLCYMGRSLKPNGLVKISVPNGADIERRLAVADWTAPKGTKNSLNAVSPLEHINCFSRGSLIKMAEIAGLEEVRIPMRFQYAHKSTRKPLKEMVRNVLRPLYLNVLRKGTYLFFRRKQQRR